MRIAIISAPKKRRPPAEYVKSLAEGMESAGHTATIFDAYTEDGRKLPAYEYVVIAAEQETLFGGRMSAVLASFLANSSGLGGKKGAAFLKKTGPFTGRALANLMKAMEKEGMMINWSDVLLNAPHAEALGKRIGA